MQERQTPVSRGNVLMPLRAFFDSDSPARSAAPGSRCVLMPLRAFFDSDNAKALGLEEQAVGVLMPLRAFFDSDDAYAPDEQRRAQVLMPLRAFFDSDLAHPSSHPQQSRS